MNLSSHATQKMYRAATAKAAYFAAPDANSLSRRGTASFRNSTAICPNIQLLTADILLL